MRAFDILIFLIFRTVAVKMGLKPEEDKRPSKMAIMDEEDSDIPSEYEIFKDLFMFRSV